MKEISRKIILAGHFGVGKTSLVGRFVHHKFSEKYLTTIGVNIEKKVVNAGDTSVSLIIWDVAGEKALKRINGSYFLGSNGIILVFDLTQPDTYQNIAEMVQTLKDRVQREVPVVVVGNKRDLVNDNELAAIKAQIDHDIFAYTSAKTGEKVEDTFLSLTHQLV